MRHTEQNHKGASDPAVAPGRTPPRPDDDNDARAAPARLEVASWQAESFPVELAAPRTGERFFMNRILQQTAAARMTPERWVETHGDLLFHFAIGQVRAAGEAEDLVQETFLAALRTRDRVGGHCSERTWLVSIPRHKICDHFRRHVREREHRDEPMTPRHAKGDWDDTMLWLHEVAAETHSPSRRIELEELRANLERALGRLAPRLAQVFQLYAIEELPNAEVCARLNISESNLWVMLHRARKHLRAHLEQG